MYSQQSQRFECKSSGPLLAVPKIWMQIFGTAITGPKVLKANLQDRYQRSQRFECKSLGLLSAVPKIWLQIL